MEKYYTPEIEEFHAGFECETYVHTSTIGNKEGYSDWYPIIFGETNTKYESLALGEVLHKAKIDVNHFRVKYLDKEDIESLGFKFERDQILPDNSRQIFKNIFVKDNLALIYNYETKELSTFTIDPIKDESGQFSTKLNIDYARIGRLIIKNKSELKKLLKQLEIDE